MGAAFGGGGFAVEDGEAAVAGELAEALDEPGGVATADGAEIDAGAGDAWDDVSGVFADASGFEAADVEAWSEHAGEVGLVVIAWGGGGEVEVLSQLVVEAVGFVDGVEFGGGVLVGVVVEAGDEDAAGVVVHGAEEAGEFGSGVESEVAEVPGMEFVGWPPDGEFEFDVAAYAEGDVSAAEGVGGAVAEQPDVGCGEEVAVAFDVACEVGACGFFFAFDEDDEVDGGVDAGVAEGVERGEQGDDGRLVVGGGASVDAAVVGQGMVERCVVESDAAAVDAIGEEGGSPGGDGPVGVVGGLPVVVGVDADGAVGAGVEGGDHGGRGIGIVGGV